MSEEIRKTYRVVEKIAEAPSVSTLKLAIDDGSGKKYAPPYRPGQFINVYFPELGTPEGKSYSISSAPSEPTLNITVKAMGQFSNRLCSLEKGDTFTASLPYGYFYTESDDTALVMIAGGIGVAPFRSMIVDSIARRQHRKLNLFCSYRAAADIIFKKEFDALAAAAPSDLKIFYFVTREQCHDPAIIPGRMSVSDIIGNSRKGRKHIAGREFFICGSIQFVSSFWKGLRKQGVPEEMMCTESFFSH